MIKRETTHATRWLAMRHLTYVDPAGAERGWDSVARSTRSPGAVADAVCVFATLRRANEPDRVLLVRQFRPPLDAETIELPAGLIDGDEAPEIAALRELKEETGYVGTLTTEGTTGTTGTTTTPAMPLSPGLSDETVCLGGWTGTSTRRMRIPSRSSRERLSPCTPCRKTRSGRLDQLAARGYKVPRGSTSWPWGWRWGEGEGTEAKAGILGRRGGYETVQTIFIRIEPLNLSHPSSPAPPPPAPPARSAAIASPRTCARSRGARRTRSRRSRRPLARG